MSWRSARAIAPYREALALAEAADEPQLLFPCYDGRDAGGDDADGNEDDDEPPTVSVKTTHCG